MQNSPARAVIDVGSVIADTYTIEALIGRGGMGAVFLASHKRLPGKKVAIKMLHAELLEEEVLARFRREAEIATRLNHPNIVQVHDFNVLPDGTPYLILELLHGETLAQRLKNGPLSIEQATSIARQVGSALAAAHREGIVHRDLKPQNIFLVPTEMDGRTAEIAKVLDFGISKIRGSQTVKTQDSALLGTPQYMAPEQAMGQHANVDERTDVFALGLIVYEMLTGQPAFTGASIPEVVFKVVYEQPAPLEQVAPTVTPQVLGAVQQAMQKQSSDRFPTVSAFIESLTGQPLSTRPGSLNLPAGEVSLPTGSRARSTGNEAFAKTMGSGDHGASPHAATMPSQPGAVAPPSRPSQPIVSGPGATQPAVGSNASITAAPQQPKKSLGLVIGAALVCAALAAVAMYFVMRGNKPARETHEKVAQTDVGSAQHIEPVGSAVAVEAPKQVEAPKIETPKVEAPKVETPKVEAPKQVEAPKKTPAEPKRGDATKKAPDAPKNPPPDEVDDESDATAKEKLQAAELALRGGQLTRAEALANTVINSPTATPAQKAHAAGIRGAVRCLEFNDEEGARNNLRAIPARFPRIRQRVFDACRSVGLLRAN